MKSILRSASFFAFAAAAIAAHADSTTYSLLDLYTSPNYQDANAGQTFTGTGFIGEYPSSSNFCHLFGLEFGNYSQTNAQVNLTSLAGKIVTSATLSYSLVTSTSPTGVATITGFASNGTLSYLASPPVSNFGVATGTTLATNTVDVTSLVTNALAANSSYLGLLLQNTGTGYAYSYTYTGYGYNADSAQVRLNVTYANPTPEPSAFAALGLGAVAMLRRRKRA